MPAIWANIPLELRTRHQWCIAAPPGMYSEKGKEPLSLDANGKFYLASSISPGTWLTFEHAANWANHYSFDLGYMLHETDPYTCIDFDIKDAQSHPDKPQSWTTPEQYDFYVRAIRTFDSYTEFSKSGKGFHVWIKAEVGRGLHQWGIEVYSRERFMICTGNVTHIRPIEDRQVHVQGLIEYLRPKDPFEGIVLEDAPEEADDWYILQMAIDATNSDKFTQLWYGLWPEMGYPSQSEADLALLSMFTFYTPNNDQVRRLFRMSGLGKRDKATKNNDYLNRTIRTIRAREKNEQSVDLTAIGQSAELLTSLNRDRLAAEELSYLQGSGAQASSAAPMHVPGQPAQQPVPNSAAIVAAAAPLTAEIVAAGETGMPWPPGITGRIAQFIYQSAPRPVKEVAIVAALGLMSGICGKGWHTTQSGLNMYIILVARSAVGKEAMHSGISALVRSVTQKLPIFHNFVSFDDFASGPALSKACALQPSFVNVSGEWGRKLKRMSVDDGRDQAMTTLRTVMTNMYQKSGPQAIVGGIKYSQSDNNISSVSGVAYSMIGETTPRTFYDALTDSMMEDGFLSRFLVIEYAGERPAANPHQVLTPDEGLVEVLGNLAVCADKVGKSLQPSLPVQRDEHAAGILAQFELECDHEINKTQDESYRQMWNRAALKALRVAALLAVADHHLYPVINVNHISWAIDVVRRDISIMQRRIETGDVGVNDVARERKTINVLRNYLERPLTKTHAAFEKFRSQAIVPRSYLQIYTAQSSAFNKFRGGSTLALNLTLQSLIDSGYLAEVPKEKASKDFSFSGKLYRILNVSKFEYEG